MPLVNIYLAKGKSPDYLQALGNGIHQTLMTTWGIPQDDRFHIFHEPELAHFQINRRMFGIQRSDDVVVLHITTSPRTAEQKLAFYQLLPEVLNEAIGLRPEDVFVSLVTAQKEDWSFGNGEPQLLKQLVGD